MSDNRDAVLHRLEREELERIDSYRNHLRRADGPLSRDSEEQATEEENDEVVEKLLAGAERRLEQVRHALRRIGQGRGDICESCGETIKSERLAALPATVLCAECARDA